MFVEIEKHYRPGRWGKPQPKFRLARDRHSIHFAMNDAALRCFGDAQTIAVMVDAESRRIGLAKAGQHTKLPARISRMKNTASSAITSAWHASGWRIPSREELKRFKPTFDIGAEGFAVVVNLPPELAVPLAPAKKEDAE